VHLCCHATLPLQVLDRLRMTDLMVVQKIFNRLGPQAKVVMKSTLSTLAWLADWHRWRAVCQPGQR
jgi:hypothetical protein